MSCKCEKYGCIKEKKSSNISHSQHKDPVISHSNTTKEKTLGKTLSYIKKNPHT